MAIMKLLVENGADPNAVNNDNFTALFAAIHTGKLKTVKFLTKTIKVFLRRSPTSCAVARRKQNRCQRWSQR